MSNTDRWEKRHPSRDDDDDTFEDEAEFYQRKSAMDQYDRELIELKRLVKEKKNAPEKYKGSYDIAIASLIDRLEEMVQYQELPNDVVQGDIKEALEFGRYRPSLHDSFHIPRASDRELNIDRKKRKSKPKPKRKPVKKITKKPVKKVRKVVKKRK